MYIRVAARVCNALSVVTVSSNALQNRLGILDIARERLKGHGACGRSAIGLDPRQREIPSDYLAARVMAGMTTSAQATCIVSGDALHPHSETFVGLCGHVYLASIFGTSGHLPPDVGEIRPCYYCNRPVCWTHYPGRSLNIASASSASLTRPGSASGHRHQVARGEVDSDADTDTVLVDSDSDTVPLACLWGPASRTRSQRRIAAGPLGLGKMSNAPNQTSQVNAQAKAPQGRVNVPRRTHHIANCCSAIRALSAIIWLALSPNCLQCQKEIGFATDACHQHRTFGK